MAAQYSIGFIGAGKIGGTLAQLAAARSHPVILSNSRGPESLKDLVDKIGNGAKAGTVEDAANCDMVVVCVPLKAYKAVPPEKLAGKVVVDANNYYPDRDGSFPELDNNSTTSSELLAAHLKNAKVVKAFGVIMWSDLENGKPKGTKGRRALPIAGDDKEAKQKVADFIEELGFDVVDLGPLSEGRRIQPIPIPAVVTGFLLPNFIFKSVLGYLPVYGVRLTVEELKHNLKDGGWVEPK